MQQDDFARQIVSLEQSRSKANWTLSKLVECTKDVTPARALSDITAVFDALHINTVKLMGGAIALVQDVPGQDAVLRVAHEEAEPHPSLKDWRIWQPLESGISEQFRIQLFQEAVPLDKALENGSITPEVAAQKMKELISSFARDGLFFWDCKPENLCVVKKGDDATLFVLDGGAVCPMSEKHEGKLGNDTHTNLDKFGMSLEVILEKLGSAAEVSKGNPEQTLRSICAIKPDPQNHKEIQHAERGRAKLDIAEAVDVLRTITARDSDSSSYTSPAPRGGRSR